MHIDARDSNAQYFPHNMTQSIVIIGAGFAGVWSALSARRLLALHLDKNPAAADIQVVLVAPEPQLVIRPRLYEADPASLAVPLTDLFGAAGVRFVQGSVETIRTEQKEVIIIGPTGAESTLPYDRLVLAAGSSLVRPPVPGLGEHAFNVDQLSAAVELEAHLQGLKSQPPSPARNTVIVCGAGFTGIELATELPARLRSILGVETETKVLLVSQGEQVGDTLGPGPRPVISQALKELGIETKLGVRITAIDADGITTHTGERIEAMTTIWTAGVAATKLTQQIPGTKDALGRLHVDQDLRLPSDGDIFVAGDAACAPTGAPGHASMMSCQHAMPLGRAAGNNAAADLLGIPASPYSQPTYVTCLDLGDYGAVFTHGWERKMVFSGAMAKRIKTYINQSLIYPPEGSDPSKIFDAAKPVQPSYTSQQLLNAALTSISFVASRIL